MSANPPEGVGSAPAGADLRLAALAIGLWSGAFGLGTLADSLGADAVSGVLILGAGALLVVLGTAVGFASLGPTSQGRSGWVAGRGHRVSALLGLVLVGIGAGGWVMSVTVAGLHADPVSTWVQERAAVRIEAVIRGDLVLRHRPSRGQRGAQDQYEARAVATRVTARGRIIDVDLPILLRFSPPAGGAATPAASSAAGLTAESAGGTTTAPLLAAGATVLADGRLRPAPVRMGVVGVLAVSGAPRTLLRAPPLDAAATALRTGLARSTQDAGVDRDAASLIAGLAVGDESRQSLELADAMRTAGLSHLTAVSGGNTALVLLVVLGAARLAGLRTRSRVAVAALALMGFVVLVRPQPSVLRAAVMGAVVLIGTMTGSRRRGVPTLSAAVVVLLLLSPMLALSYGFALSVAATAGLLALTPHLIDAARRRRLTARLPPAVIAAATITLAAQVATAPLIASLQGGIGLAAIPANLLAAPIVAPVTMLGLTAALTAWWCPPLAVACAWLAGPFASWLALVAHTCAALPLAMVPWLDGAVGAVSVVAVLVAGFGALRYLRGRSVDPRVARAVVGAVLAASAVLILRPPARVGWPPPGWVLVVCDVGQGDASVLRVDEVTAVVVDAGPDPDLVDGCLRDLGITAVAALVLTHFHADHVDGVPGVLRGRSVASVVTSPLREPAPQAGAVDRWLATAGLTAAPVTTGDERRVGPLRWQALWPSRIIRGQGSLANNASVVLLAEDAGVRILLGADVEPAAQVGLRGNAAPLRVDVVKVPHHGSSHQDPRFASWAAARLALVSVGVGNDYGHPSSVTLNAYRVAGALIGRTDLGGDLAVVRDGDGSIGLVSRR